MRRNTQATLEQVLDFLGLEVDRQAIADAVADNTVDKMRVRENRAEKLHKSPREEGRFVRQGAVMGWREKLTEAQLDLIERYAGETMIRMGYPGWKSVIRDTPQQELAGIKA
jgi:hypothetical protein